MARVGRGPTLGDAIIDAFRVLRRPPAMSIRAQLAQLTKAARGQEILARYTNPGPGGRNWYAWLSEARAPSAHNRAQIEAAYAEYIGRSPAGQVNHGAEGQIHGEVAFGRYDVRERGNGTGTAPMKIDHHVPPASTWSHIDALLLTGNPSPDRVLEFYVYDVLAGTIDFSDPPYFPGSSYTFVVV